jgi:hypothetical protein
VTVALRVKTGGVLLLALAGLLMGAAAMVGVIPVTPPALLAPALALGVAGLTVVKVAAVGGAFVAYARSRA